MSKYLAFLLSMSETSVFQPVKSNKQNSASKRVLGSVQAKYTWGSCVPGRVLAVCSFSLEVWTWTVGLVLGREEAVYIVWCPGCDCRLTQGSSWSSSSLFLLLCRQTRDCLGSGTSTMGPCTG